MGSGADRQRLKRAIGSGVGGGVTVHVQGIDSLDKAFDRLLDFQKGQVLRRMLTRGATVVRNRMKAIAPVSHDKDPGQLRKAITRLSTKVRRRRGFAGGGFKSWVAYVVIGPRHKLAPHRSWVVHGTKLRAKKMIGIGGLGQITGRMKPNPFPEEALEDTRRQASERMTSFAAKFIQEAWGRG